MRCVFDISGWHVHPLQGVGGSCARRAYSDSCTAHDKEAAAQGANKRFASDRRSLLHSSSRVQGLQLKNVIGNSKLKSKSFTRAPSQKSKKSQTWGVAKGSSVSWVAKFKGDKNSECKLSNGWSRSYKVMKMLLSAGK